MKRDRPEQELELNKGGESKTGHITIKLPQPDYDFLLELVAHAPQCGHPAASISLACRNAVEGFVKEYVSLLPGNDSILLDYFLRELEKAASA